MKNRDPRAKKARDNAKRTTRRHKLAASAARKIKTHTNRKARHAGKIAVHEADEIEETAGITPKLNRKRRLYIWPAENANERRAWRKKERAYLDETTSKRPRGRRRAVQNRRDWDR